MRRVAGLVLGMVGVAGTAFGAGHPIGARLTAGGLDFIEGQVGKFLPMAFYPANITKQVFSCPGDDATVNQVGSAVALHLDSLDLSLPSPGRIRVDAVISGQLSGELRLTKVVACAGSINCFDRVQIRGVRITAELGVSVTGGMPDAELIDLEVTADANDLEVEIYECGLAGSITTAVVSKVKDAVFDQLLAYGNDLAMEKLPPMLDETLAGVGALKFSGSIPQASIDAQLASLEITTGGIEMRAELDASASGDMNACLGGLEDPGDPEPPSAAMPELARDAHVGVGLSASLINETIYQVWRAGFMCVTDDLLAIVGVELDTAEMSALLPGVPLGSRMSFGMRFAKPPTVTFYDGENATVGIEMTGMTATIDLVSPDGDRTQIDATIDAEATAEIRLVPGANVMTMRLVSAHVGRMEITDETGADALGMDFGRIRTLVETTVLPAVGEMLGEVPLTGSVFGEFEGMYVILKELRTTDAFLVAGIDLFAAPEDDETAPETTIDERPNRPVRPEDAIVRVSGIDAEVPSTLLQFEITSGGVRQDPTFLGELKVGRVGESGVYQVEVRAIDLAGNTDGSPARTEVTVDGIPPTMQMNDAPIGSGHGPNPFFRWDMDDDMTAPGSLAPRIEIFKIDGHSSEPIDEVVLAPGATETSLPTLENGTYRAIVIISDAVGNEASDARIFTVGDGQSVGLGCATGGSGRTGIGAGSLWLLALAVLALRRR